MICRFSFLVRVASLLVLTLCIVGGIGFARAQDTAQATRVVSSFYSTLQAIMKDGPLLGFDGRYVKLDPAVRKAFDLPLMARYAVGPSWREADRTQQDRLVEAFSSFSIATYASRFKKYDGEVFEILGEKPMGETTMVETRLIPKGEPPIRLNYRLRKNTQGEMKIVDVYLDGSISELATRRADFSAVIKREGVSALVTSLENKVIAMKSGKDR